MNNTVLSSVSNHAAVISDAIDRRVYDLFKSERMRIKKRLKTTRTAARIVTAAEQRQQAREFVLDQMAEDVFEATGTPLTHRDIKDIVTTFEEEFRAHKSALRAQGTPLFIAA